MRAYFLGLFMFKQGRLQTETNEIKHEIFISLTIYY